MSTYYLAEQTLGCTYRKHSEIKNKLRCFDSIKATDCLKRLKVDTMSYLKKHWFGK